MNCSLVSAVPKLKTPRRAAVPFLVLALGPSGFHNSEVIAVISMDKFQERR